MNTAIPSTKATRQLELKKSSSFIFEVKLLEIYLK